MESTTASSRSRMSLASVYLAGGRQCEDRWCPGWLWPIVAAAIIGLGVTGLHFASDGPLALWWPAAGVSVWFAVTNPAQRRVGALVLVFAATATANLLGGRVEGAAFGLGLANAAEAAVVSMLLNRGGQRLRLESATRAIAVFLAVVLGAATAGLIAGTTLALFGGSFVQPLVGVTVSHAAAVLLVVPFALLPEPLPAAAGSIERFVQAGALAAVVVVTFYPGSHLPLAFLPHPLLAWAAFRMPLRLVVAETLPVGALALVLTLNGGGPFAAASLSDVMAIALLELFIVSLAMVGLVLSASHYQVYALSRSAQEVAVLLSSGLLESRVAMLAIQDVDGRALVLWSNPAASTMVGQERDGDWWDGPVASAANRARDQGTAVEVPSATGGRLSVSVDVLVEDKDLARYRYAVQIVDVTDAVRGVEIKLEAERERAAALQASAALQRQRADLVTTASHELRTPISSIAGYAELLERAEGLSTVERGWLATINRHAARLSDLVEDLLALGRVRDDRGSNRELRACSVILLTDHVVESLMVAAQERGQGMSVLHFDEDAVVYAVYDDIARAVTALLTNAIKSTPPGGEVLVQTRRVDSMTEIVIRRSEPSGAQPSPDSSPESSPESRPEPPVGLGQLLVVELVERNGGRVTPVSPTAQDVEFSIVLPAGPSRDTTAERAGGERDD